MANDLRGLQTLVGSEFHRVYNSAVQNSGKNTGLRGVTKNWITIGDAKVRETHRYLEGQSVALDDYFYTFDGDYAMQPGGFTRAENNVNCRCIVRLMNSGDTRWTW